MQKIEPRLDVICPSDLVFSGWPAGMAAGATSLFSGQVCHLSAFTES